MANLWPLSTRGLGGRVLLGTLHHIINSRREEIKHTQRIEDLCDKSATYVVPDYAIVNVLSLF